MFHVEQDELKSVVWHGYKQPIVTYSG